MPESFLLGNSDGDRLEIEVVARQHPDKADYWDGNWVTAYVTVVAQPWSGSYEADLRTDEFAGFRDALHRLHGDASLTEARFDALEPWLNFVLRRTDRLGHVEVRGEARHSFLAGHNVLNFVLELDQTYIQPALDGLDAILREFPVRGSPE
ncbi:MAG TPA: hypothetical protein VF160_11955 [Candidatus Dormibacteraeota bacterium]